MPHSVSDRARTESNDGQGLAVAAESLYLANMLLLPGPPFLVLLWLYAKHGGGGPPLARCHLRQTVAGSLWAVVALVAVNAAILLLGGYDAPYTRMLVIVYFVCAHAALVMLGTLGLAKAMAGQNYRYPLVGRPCE